MEELVTKTIVAVIMVTYIRNSMEKKNDVIKKLVR